MGSEGEVEGMDDVDEKEGDGWMKSTEGREIKMKMEEEEEEVERAGDEGESKNVETVEEEEDRNNERV